MKRFSVILSALIFATCSIFAQVKMEVVVPPVVDVSEDYFQIQFVISEVNVSNFTPPSLSDFEVLSGPYSSVRSSQSYINGKMHREASTTYTYTLAPKSKGTFTIGEATAVVNGKTVHSSSKSFKITGDGKPKSHGNQQQQRQTQPSRPENIGKIAKSDLFIGVSANRKKIYEQEPILLTYKFYARPEVMLSQIGIQQKPDFKGMLSQDIPVKNIYMNIEDINGISYRTGVIQKYVIFPQGAGKITIPGITFNCDIMQRDASIDPFEAFFNGGGTISKTVQRKVDDIDLDIQPLPQPKPQNFSGGVGQFSIQGEMLTPEYKTNDVVTYRITISGTGNLKLIETPELNLDDDFDVYTPKTVEETTVTEKGITGQMIYEYTFVPRKVGEYEVPAIELCYFDPSSDKYKSVSTTPVKMHVVKGSKTNEEYQRTQSLQRSDIHDLRNSATSVASYEDFFWWGKFSYWLVYILISVITFVLFTVFKKFIKQNADIISRKSKKAAKMATRRMKTAKSFMADNRREDFYTEVAHALYGYIADKYNISLSELNRNRIESELTSSGTATEAVQQFLHLLDECDFAQYAPSDQVMGMNDMYNQAINAIVDIEKLKNA